MKTQNIRRSTASAVTVAMLALTLSPQPVHAQWHDNSGSLPGISSAKSAILLGAALSGAAVLWGVIRKHRDYPLDVADKAMLVDGDATIVSLINKGTEVVTLSEVSFDKAEFKTKVSIPAQIKPGETFSLAVHREMPASGKVAKKTKLRLIAIRPDGKHVERTVAIQSL